MAETTGTPSLAGPARRSRRLQGTPTSASKFGHGRNAVAASDSPYARRPQLERDPSSHVLAALEAGGDHLSTSAKASPPPVFSSKAERRRSTGPESLLGRVRKSLGWLVGRGSPAGTAEDEEESLAGGMSGKINDEESTIPSSNSANYAPRSFNGLNGPAYTSSIPAPPPKRNFVTSPSIASGSHLASITDEPVSPKRMRSSHSTLNIPMYHSNTPTLSRYSSGPAFSRQPSPIRYASPSRHDGPSSPGLVNSRSSIFLSGPVGLPSTSDRMQVEKSGPPRSVSPALQSIKALPLPTSATSSIFGLQSQSPFRLSARSPELPVNLLDISSGLARSPSLPRQRLSLHAQQASRLYPYQRSPSLLSAGSQNSAFPINYSIGSGLSGTKRGYNSISQSPPKISPVRTSFFSNGVKNTTLSPTSTDFGSDHTHRAKRQRVGMIWDPEKGFVASDAEGKPLQQEMARQSVPKNEAERILERLESIRRPQLDGLRNKVWRSRGSSVI